MKSRIPRCREQNGYYNNIILHILLYIIYVQLLWSSRIIIIITLLYIRVKNSRHYLYCDRTTDTIYDVLRIIKIRERTPSEILTPRFHIVLLLFIYVYNTRADLLSSFITHTHIIYYYYNTAFYFGIRRQMMYRRHDNGRFTRVYFITYNIL